MRHRILVTMFLLAAATLQPSFCIAQNIKVVDKTKIYRREIKKDSSNLMVELKEIIPRIVYDLRYATKNNFTATQLYSHDKFTFLRLPVAKALGAAEAILNKKGFGFKIFDAYRPYSTTQKMWELIKDERYVANPAKGSGHNRGLSADLTIIDVATGKELDMGTDFDNFTDTAHHTFNNLPQTILENRRLLKTTMEAQGFKALDTEWWHYTWPNDKGYTILNLSFNQIKKTI